VSPIAEQLCTLTNVCPGARLMTECGQEFVFLPDLSVTVGKAAMKLDALLCPSGHSGYATRLFLSEPITDRPTIRGQAANWSTHVVLGRTWHTWSWRDVSPGLPLLQILLGHLAALR